MSTRSAVCRPEGDGWRGPYVHSDGYPTGVGAALFAAHSETFAGDTEAMRVALVDREKIGWSALAGFDLAGEPHWSDGPGDEWRKPDGGVDWEAYWSHQRTLGPKSYTARGESPEHAIVVTQDENTQEWAYILTDAALMIVKHAYSGEITGTWFVPWDTPPADAERLLAEIENKGYGVEDDDAA